MEEIKLAYVLCDTLFSRKKANYLIPRICIFIRICIKLDLIYFLYSNFIQQGYFHTAKKKHICTRVYFIAR